MQSGTSLYLAIIVLIILLAIVLGLTSILLGQMKMVQEIGYSIIALSAADAGIEKILVIRGDPTNPPYAGYYNDSLDNGVTYEILVTPAGIGGCPPTVPDYCIKSVGTYQGVRRAIEIVY